jgi:prephenate dehydrogenase
MIRRLCIIGVGLIGGSLARALRQRGYCQEVVGSSRRREHLQEAVDRGVIDRYETDAGRAVAGADMVLIAVPLGAMEAVLGEIRGRLAEAAIITDVGSAKGSVVAAARAVFGEIPARFVPGHPIAGTEKSGVAASFASLFDGRQVILTPLPETDPAATEQVRQMWLTAGAAVQLMDVAHHDRVLAATSHLPHLLAYAVVDSLARLGDHDEIFRYAAGGFRDFSRIAGSDPVMWRDICLANRDAILDIVGGFSEDIARLVTAIRAGDGDTLLDVFARAKSARDRYTDGTH